MRITTTTDNKGGTGKTTTGHALATGIPRIKAGTKTLAIDFDPSGNLSCAYALDDYENKETMLHVITGDVSIHDAIQHLPQGDIIPGNISLTHMSRVFDSYLKGVNKLKEQLTLLESEYTHIIIDNQPRTGDILTDQAFIASTDIIISTTADEFSLKGLSVLKQKIETIKDVLNPTLRVDGFLLTKHEANTTLTKNLTNELAVWANAFDSKTYKTYIRRSVSIREAQRCHQSIFDYAPQATASMDYIAFIKEYLKAENGGRK